MSHIARVTDQHGLGACEINNLIPEHNSSPTVASLSLSGPPGIQRRSCGPVQLRLFSELRVTLTRVWEGPTSGGGTPSLSMGGGVDANVYPRTHADSNTVIATINK